MEPIIPGHGSSFKTQGPWQHAHGIAAADNPSAKYETGLLGKKNLQLRPSRALTAHKACNHISIRVVEVTIGIGQCDSSVTQYARMMRLLFPKNPNLHD